MKLEFTDTRIKEFVDGPLHYKNDGSDIEVSAATAGDLLNAKHLLDGEWVNVFKTADSQGTKKELAEKDLTYPEGFPASEALAAAGFTHEEALLLTREQLLEVTGIGEKSADAILEFTKEK